MVNVIVSLYDIKKDYQKMPMDVALNNNEWFQGMSYQGDNHSFLVANTLAIDMQYLNETFETEKERIQGLTVHYKCL